MTNYWDQQQVTPQFNSLLYYCLEQCGYTIADLKEDEKTRKHKDLPNLPKTLDGFRKLLEPLMDPDSMDLFLTKHPPVKFYLGSANDFSGSMYRKVARPTLIQSTEKVKGNEDEIAFWDKYFPEQDSAPRRELVEKGLQFFRDELEGNPDALERVMTCLVEYAEDVHCSLEPSLVADWDNTYKPAEVGTITSMGEGNLEALLRWLLWEMIMKKLDAKYKRALILEMSDGGTTGNPFIFQLAVKLFDEAQRLPGKRGILSFPVSIDTDSAADRKTHSQFHIEGKVWNLGTSIFSIFSFASTASQTYSVAKGKVEAITPDAPVEKYEREYYDAGDED